MGEVESLKLARKRKARAAREAEAAANRTRFGRSKPDRKLVEAREALAAQKLDGHKRET